MTITDLVASIDRRLTELDTELAPLTVARAALVNPDGPAAGPEARPASRSPVTPSYDVVPAGKLITLLAGGEGMRTRELSHATNSDPGQVLLVLKEQEHAGQVRRTGTRAATRWHAVTDEDRVPTRPAALQGTSRHSRARKN